MEKLAKMDKKALEEKLSTGKYVLFFTADWCPDCRFIKPAMPEIEANFSQFEFILVDRDENIDLCQEMMIMGIPSFVVYEDGKEKVQGWRMDSGTDCRIHLQSACVQLYDRKIPLLSGRFRQRAGCRIPPS